MTRFLDFRLDFWQGTDFGLTKSVEIGKRVICAPIKMDEIGVRPNSFEVDGGITDKVWEGTTASGDDGSAPKPDECLVV